MARQNKHAGVAGLACALTIAYGGQASAAPQLPGVQTAYQAWNLYRCYQTRALADGGMFADSSTFECGLNRALRDRQDEPVRIVFSGSDPTLQTAATDSQIRAALPGRMERWARAVDQTGGNVFVCREGVDESWPFLLGLAATAAEWIMRQLSPSGTAFYAPALRRDLFIEYQVTANPAGSRLVGATFQPRQESPEVPEGCQPARLDG